MRVLIIGAGEVGTHVAQLLSREGHDVTVIESNAARIAELDKLLDVSIVHGNANDPEVMIAAGVRDVDLVVAATSHDEVNLVASLIAKIEGVKRRVVRLERPSLRGPQAAKLRATTGADIVIDPDDAVAQEILDLVTYPGAIEIARLADDELLMVAAKLSDQAPFAGQTLEEIGAEYAPNWPFIVSTITRDGQTIVPRSDHCLQTGDTVRVVCRADARTHIMAQLGLAGREHHRIMILGGGRTGEILARQLVSTGHEVAIIDRDPVRARELAECLDHVLILMGDITDGALLEEEDIGAYDAVVALTGEDDANILACLYAKRAGTRETIAVLHRLELRELLREAGVDVVISPRTASANDVLRALHGGVSAVATSLDDDIEFYEVVVARGSSAEGKTVANLGMPHNSLVAAIVRDDVVQIGRGHLQLQRHDHVVVVAHGKDVDRLSRLFTES